MASIFAGMAALANNTASVPVADAQHLDTEEQNVGMSPAAGNVSAVACTIHFCSAT